MIMQTAAAGVIGVGLFTAKKKLEDLHQKIRDALDVQQQFVN